MIIKYDFTDFTNPFGHHENVKEAMKLALEQVRFYPDSDYKELQKILSYDQGFEQANIAIVNGGAEAIFLLPKLIKPSQTGIIQPTFSRYRLAALSVGSNIVDILLNDDFSLPLIKILSVIPELDMIYICNPNNPTGNTHKLSDILEIIEKAERENCFVVVDEVYMDFANKPSNHSVKNYIQDFDNLAIISSFSKIFSIPGLRIGYLISNNEVIESIKDAIQPWPVNKVAIAAATAGLKENKYLENTLRKTKIARQMFVNELKSLNMFDVFNCDSNIICVKTKKNNTGQMIKNKLLEEGILTKTLEKYLMLDKDYLYFGVRKPFENGLLVEALREIISKQRLVA